MIQSMFGRGFKGMLMKARYCLVILGVVLALQHGVVSTCQHLNQTTLLLTGIVVTVHESRVGNVKVELAGNGSKKVTETDPYGTFQFKVSPERYSLSVSAPGFCPFKRPEFEIKPSAVLVLTIIPCGAGNVLRYDKEDRYAGEERKYISNFKNDLLTITNSNGPSFDLSLCGEAGTRERYRVRRWGS